MKSNQYIKLHQTSTGAEVYINNLLIISMSPDEGKTYISTMSDKRFVVKETIDEIMKLIDKANSFTFTTK
jgi:uncharacterized protein YlzI (FlbEa/FlbD family)